jgi:primase-polymerase (primpol)-like protein
MTRVHNFEGIPSQLKQIPHWMLWKNIVSDKYPRGRKIPLDAGSLARKQGDSTKPETWSDFDTCMMVVDAIPKLSGVAFVLQKNLNIFTVDVDECCSYKRNGIFEINSFGKEILEVFSNRTYVEASFHLDGLHVQGYGSLPEGMKGGRRESLDKQHHIEIYDDVRMICQTGIKMQDSSAVLVDCQEELDYLAKEFPVTKKDGNNNQNTTIPKKTFSGENITDRLGLRCTMPDNPVKKPHGWQGANPWHGSSTGSNYCLNERDNTWFCFRCQSGGSGIEAFAVEHGIIDCSQAGSHCLDGKWPEVFEALKNAGYDLVKAGLEKPIFGMRETAKNRLKALGVL